MVLLRRVVVLVVALGLSGCWLQPGYGPEHQNFNPFESQLTGANAATLQPAWSTAWDASGQPLVTPAAVVSGRIRGTNLVVRAVSRRTGAPLWRRDLGLTTLVGTGPATVLSVANDEVLTARADQTNNFVFERLDLETGATTARNIAPEAFDVTTIAVSNDVIAYRGLDVGGPGFELVVRDRDTFDLLWTAPTSLSSGSATMLLVDGKLYRRETADDDVERIPVIEVFDLDGCGEPTCSPLSTMVVPPPPPETGFAIYGAQLISVTDDGHLVVQRGWHDDRQLRPGTDLITLAPDGTLDWSMAFDAQQYGLFGVAVAGDTILAVGADEATPAGEVTLFGRSGTSTWRSDDVVDHLAPVAAGGLVFVGADVFAVDGCGSATCPPLATVDLGTDAGAIQGESITAGTLYVNAGGHLTAFTPTDT